MEPKEGDQQEPIQTAADRLAVQLTEPLKETPAPPLSSHVSETATVLQILQGQSLRIDQMGKVLDLLAGRMEAVMTEMIDTMKLAQIVIAAQDTQLTELSGMLERLETATQALVIVQGNLSELVAAIVHDDSNQKA